MNEEDQECDDKYRRYRKKWISKDIFDGVAEDIHKYRVVFDGIVHVISRNEVKRNDVSISMTTKYSFVRNYIKNPAKSEVIFDKKTEEG